MYHCMGIQYTVGNFGLLPGAPPKQMAWSACRVGRTTAARQWGLDLASPPMLNRLNFQNVGLCSDYELQLSSGLNLLTGLSGRGKSLVLNTAWWALTRSWPAEANPLLRSGMKLVPRSTGKASVGFRLWSQDGDEDYAATHDRRAQAWIGPARRPMNRGLVLYALDDGSFAVWDPARNYWRTDGTINVQERPPAYVLTSAQVWNGMVSPGVGWLCNGLVRDWATWQNRNGPEFLQLCKVLEALSPSTTEVITPGHLTRVDLTDARDMPTLLMQAGEEVPVVHASSAVKRIVGLAYLLVWSWHEHRRACALLGESAADEMTVLIDDIDSHLDTRWQRRIFNGVREAVDQVAPGAHVQGLATAHSQHVLASLEQAGGGTAVATWFELTVETVGSSSTFLAHRRAL
jgi:hypothetical protein